MMIKGPVFGAFCVAKADFLIELFQNEAKGMILLNVKEFNVEDIREYEDNPRNNDGAVEAVAESIRRFGWKVPIVIDADSVIVAGHTRFKAAKRLGMDKVPCIVADDLTDEQVRAYRLADNKTAELSEWDFSLLEKELAGLEGFGMEAFGFDDSLFDMEEDEWKEADALDENRETLQDRFIVPPFSVLDTKQGYWQERKEIWKRIIRSDEGRDVGLLGKGLYDLAQKQGKTSLTGTSIFDPVLCEILVNWFCPTGGKVLDPFAGGSVRGLISVLLGNDYTGIDLRAEQTDANYRNYRKIADRKDLNGNDLREPIWITEDSRNLDSLVAEKHDFLMTCPPYADLEVYSDDPRDISTMEYDDFREAYFEIIGKACERLKDDAFAAIVVGEVRDGKGRYRNFVGDTIEAFREAGLAYYNECILLNQISTAAVRAGRQFNALRKVVKTHQNVLVFVKGDEKRIVERLGRHEYDIEDVEE